MRIAAFAVALWFTAGCAPWRADARGWASAQPTIIRELRARARPLAELDAEVPPATPVWAMVRSARVIGVGEGTREFLRLLHALVIHAAHEEQPLALALEMPFDMALALDAWAATAGSRARSRDLSEPNLLGADWLGAVQEYRDLFTWIRDFNRDALPERQIRIVGVDVCMSFSCGSTVVDYIADVDLDIEPRARDLVVPLRRHDLERTRSTALAARARENLAELRTMLAERRDRIVERRGAHTYDVAQRLVWLAERRVDIALVGGGNPVSDERELAMAATTAWIRDRLGNGGWVLVHAHNLHVGRARDRMPNRRLSQGTNMGQHIATRFGSDYAVVYNTFDASEFLAYHTRGWIGAEGFKTRDLRAFPVRSAPRGTFEATLRAPAAYALDVREAAAAAGPLADYLRAEHWSRSFTYAWRRSFAAFPVAWTGVVPAADFDVLVYVPRAAATHP